MDIVVTSVQPLNVPTTFSPYFVLTWVTPLPVALPPFGPAIAALMPRVTSAPIDTSAITFAIFISPSSGRFTGPYSEWGTQEAGSEDPASAVPRAG